MSQKIANRVKPGTAYCAYTEYETDENGQYTYFVGEEVYIKFKCGPGEMPIVCINAWREIWQMQENDLGGKRT